MFRLMLLLAALLALAVPAVAKDKNLEDDDKRTTYERRDRDDRGTFSSAERNMIRSWLSEQERRAAVKHPPTGLPPGLQKKVARGKALPPGWQKKLARGEYIDDEYYGWGRALPDDLLHRLPPAPAGSEILQIEDQIIRLDAATRTILDVFGLGGY
jgi:hypothetical protein